ncbi:MAG: universal stress protein [Steroidobacteraceae bacterium]
MNAPHEVLVAVDGSEAARRALRFAIELARRAPGMTLHLLTVRPAPIVYGEVEVYLGRERAAARGAERASEILTPLLSELSAADVPFDSESIEGDIVETIARRCRELGCGQVIMGTHGRSRAANAVLGSIAAGVVHRVDVPVTLVR